MPVRAFNQACAGLAALIICSMCEPSAAATADAPPLVLQHLTTADGLPQATVMSTLQDSQGFVWLGTEDGLVRYDGHELYRYAYTRGDPSSLPGNFIWEIVEDAHRDLWIAVKEGGVARWNRASDTFTVYRHDPRDPNSLASDAVRALVLDALGHVWIGTTENGVDVLDPATGRIRHLRHDARDPGSLVNDRIFTLARARSGDIWIGTETGLDKWHAATGTLTRFGPPGMQISRVLEDRGGAVWVATYDHGLLRLDRDGRVLEAFRHDERRADSLQADDVRALLEDQAGHLWVGTVASLDLLDRESGRFAHYRHDANDADSLRDSNVMSLYEDRAGLVWIGTRAGGVSRWNPRSWELGGHRPAALGSAPVTAFADAPGNRVWIATLGAGLLQFDAATGELTPLDALVGRRNALADARVMWLRNDRRGALWIGTMTSGLKRLTPDGRVESIPVKAGDPHATSEAGIMAVVETRGGQIWIGTYGGGANILDPATGTVRQLPFGAAPGAISGPIVTSLAEDARGYMWVGTESTGLSLIRGDGTLVRTFRHDPHDAKSFPAGTIYAIAVDAQNRVWIATDGSGLVRVLGSPEAPESIAFEMITRAQGLSSDTLYGVVPDAAGGIWLSGNAGLVHFDPEKGTVKTYHREHGLQGEEFSFGAYARLRDGRMAFGGPGGFNIFDPARLTENRQPPRLALTGIEVLGVRMRDGTAPWLRNQIDLDYRGSIVSLDLGVLDFTSPQHNRLAYRMPGLIDRWINLGAQRRITLTNLDAGDHVLEVRAANSDSVWSTTPLRVTIHRDPAPWRSPWAYAVYTLVVLALILYRVHKQRAKFREMARARARLESEVQLRTRELVESNRQLAEAARAKSDFLDRMSHELRTPMNGVVGMTELLARTPLSATQAHLTKTIRSSAQILLQIVNDLLDLSKIRAGKVALEALPIDLAQVLEECTSLFAGAAEDKGIELIVCPPARFDRVLLGDPLRVRQILMNLVGNAVKFTSHGEVVVRADIGAVEGERATVRIAVSDTGIGMDAAAMERIFEPFSQADETTTRRFGGTGLGLAICRELADLMGGTIEVESKSQIGSTFCLSLPLQVSAEPSAPEALRLPTRAVRILTRRPSLEEALSRHAAALGLVVVRDSRGEGELYGEPIVVLDARTHRDELKHFLAGADASRAALVVIATAADAEALGLRVLMHEQRIVLEPVHRIAFREALAAAMGLQVESLTAHTVEAAPLQGHVLLVEDEPVNAAVAEGYLAALGCTSVTVRNGADAVARSAAERFDLILMDLNMPDMDGFAATALIRKREAAGARVPIIALTAHDALNYRDKCLKAGMDDILSKPCALDECARLLRRWLARGEEAPAKRAAAQVPASTNTPASLSTIDVGAVAALRKLRADKHADLYSKLVALFRSGSADALGQLRAAFAAGDLATAAAICHKLSSSAANVGALAYAQHVRQLERLCVAGERAQALELHGTLQAAYAPLIDALDSMSIRATA
ncbi:MAG TPA: two-component regulator propeller domain-containing protein [Steroidobacteraceae bacterium]|nr:two-component regulator propeller domain-containing protein [Steroidobacteraceae bacterium]